MKIVVIGIGSISQTHLAAWNRIDQAEIVALVDPEPGRADAAAAVYGGHPYQHIDDMLTCESVDIVDICAPTDQHAQLAVGAMKKRCHVLCEKPIALTVAEGQAMIDQARISHVTFMVAQVIRFWPEYVYLKTCLQRKTYGDLQHAWFSRTGSFPMQSWQNWMLDAERSGRVPYDLHIHDLDFIRNLNGDPDSVDATRAESGAISYICSRFQYPNGCILAEAGWYGSKPPFQMSFRAVFDRAVLIYEQGRLICYTDCCSEQIGFEQIQVWCDDSCLVSPDAYQNELAYFASCVRSGRAVDRVPPQDSLESLRWVDRALIHAVCSTSADRQMRRGDLA